VKYLDIIRVTHTDLESKSESFIGDIWTEDGAESLSESWRGRTVFHLLKPPAPPGFSWIEGPLTKKQMSLRPDNIWPEMWIQMSKKAKREAIEKWSIEGPRRDAARNKRALLKIDPEDAEFKRLTQELRAKLEVKKAPAMPLLTA
jgi:hypothetical protein